jgi:hydrogenase maturation protein HypF
LRPPETRKRIEIRGVVQGVGFRPFVYRIATRLQIRGWVLNSSSGAVIESEGAAAAVERFLAALARDLPPLARIDHMGITELSPRGQQQFVIRDSEPAAATSLALVPPDIAPCADCLREIADPHDRRYAYPFTNCTNCGPRYSMIREVPYDRARTTMAMFRMCALCQAEYDDPSHRRFHAEPNACPACGPRLGLVSTGSPGFDGHHHAILARVRDLLRDGQIVAVKGVGGFHLACDAGHDAAVRRLREHKRRSGKAFALMVRDIEAAEKLCHITDADRSWLLSPSRPIVLLPRRKSSATSSISAHVAPGTSRLGLMLPPTPLHHLLFESSNGPDALVMTSGNVSEEPIVSRNQDAWPRLRHLADWFLFHNRDIQTAVDDSVLQTFAGSPYPVRRSRGFAPEPIDIGRPVHSILACGGELKSAFCLTKDQSAILSQHIGDLENLETMEFFRDTLCHLQRFFAISPAAAVHDLHPNYLSSRFAREESGLPAIGVQHHHAHIASCMADNGLTGRVIGVALDGTGYGLDGRIWGGEFLTCRYAAFRRHGHLRYVPLAGGDRAIRQPWRSALAYLRSIPHSPAIPSLPLFAQVPARELAIVETMLARQLQTVETSSCGRLFDAVASLTGLCQEATYEGQAAIELEMVAGDAVGVYPFELAGADPFQLDMRPAIAAIVGEVRRGVSVSTIASRFHNTMAQVVVDACEQIRASENLNRVCLSGGTFQNIRLLTLSVEGLRRKNFEVFVHRRVPTNDGGLALGQAMIGDAILWGVSSSPKRPAVPRTSASSRVGHVR